MSLNNPDVVLHFGIDVGPVASYKFGHHCRVVGSTAHRAERLSRYGTLNRVCISDAVHGILDIWSCPYKFLQREVSQGEKRDKDSFVEWFVEIIPPGQRSELIVTVRADAADVGINLICLNVAGVVLGALFVVDPATQV